MRWPPVPRWPWPCPPPTPRRPRDGAVLTVRNQVLIDEPKVKPRYAFSSVEITAPEGRYGWLNRLVLVGTLHSLRPKPQVLIRVYKVV